MARGSENSWTTNCCRWLPLLAGWTIWGMIPPVLKSACASTRLFAPCENYHEHVNFIFESFDLRDDFFKEHQKTYMSDIVRILYYTGKRYNFYDILVMTYDVTRGNQRASGHCRAPDRAAPWRQPPAKTQLRDERAQFGRILRGLQTCGEGTGLHQRDDEVSRRQALDHHPVPIGDLISIEDVIEQGQILVVSLNTNKDDSTTKALGRMILQNLQLVIGNRYERKRAGMYMPFVSVIMDEFAPIAYSNFANIL